MKYLGILVMIIGMVVDSSSENDENRIKKRGIYGEGVIPGSGFDAAAIGPASFGPSLMGNSGLYPGGNAGLQYGPMTFPSGTGGSTVSKHVTIQNNVAVPVPQPYAVPVTRTLAIPVPQPVRIPVDRPYPVRVPHPVPYPVDRPYPVAVDKPYPVPFPHPVPVKVFRPLPYPVPRPVPVPVINNVPQNLASGLTGSSFGGYGFSMGAGLPGASFNLPSAVPYGYEGLYGGKVVGLGSLGW